MARPREFDEPKVLKAARDEFWSTGYAGTSIEAITAATGLGKGSLYGAFGDKHKLFLRVFEDYCERVTADATQKLSGSDEQALERLTTYITGIAADTASDARHRGCLLAKGTAELAQHDQTVAARAHQTFDALAEALTADIEAAQRHGDINPRADAGQLALLMLAVTRGIEALGKAGEDPDKLKSIATLALTLISRPARFTNGRTPNP